jgi:hypothetical protein
VETATTSSATSQKQLLWDSLDSEDDRKNMTNKKKSKKFIIQSDNDITDHGSDETHQADVTLKVRRIILHGNDLRMTIHL